MESSIQKVSKKEKTFISLRAHGLSVYCFRLYKDLVKMMSMYVRDEKRQDIFYSLMTGTDISDLSYRYNLSIRELIFMYEEGVREVSRCWESLVQEQQRLQSVHLRYRNYKAVLHRNNVVCGQFKVFVPLKNMIYLRNVWINFPLLWNIWRYNRESYGTSGGIISICWRTCCGLSRKMVLTHWANYMV